MLRVSGTLICTTLLLALFALACSGAGDADRPAGSRLVKWCKSASSC